MNYMLPYNSYKPTIYETQFIGNLLNIAPNDISYVFFSNNNVDNINSLLIAEIKEITLKRYNKSLIIEPQNKDLLYIIMRFVYFKNIRNEYETEVEVQNLNNLTLQILVPGVTSELIARIRYLNDINRYASPYDSPTFSILPLPTNTCKTNSFNNNICKTNSFYNMQ